jgi:hypothetical protein
MARNVEHFMFFLLLLLLLLFCHLYFFLQKALFIGSLVLWEFSFIATL